jgi:uncharacterized membrane protein YGL010W
MLRNLLGFAVFAVVALLVLKLVFSLFGLVLGLFFGLVWLAFLGFVIYLILKLVAPQTAARVREMIAGNHG